jgi:hypothetical protein
MTLGLMVVGSGASYKDVSSEQNEEAIEVLQAVGVMVGDASGNFNPDSTVPRNEMAVVMSNLMAYNVATYAGTSPFTDVPSWAEPYVAACWTNGITTGYSANYYGGSDTVTTSQAALMLMKALGYFQYGSDFGDDWQLATVKQGNKIDLFEDVDSGVKEAMTRNDLAQLVLNTLEAGMVEADNNTIKVTTNDATVETGSVNYNYIASSKDYAKTISDKYPASSTNSVAGYIVELGEKLYNGDLKKDETVRDEFGRPSTQWTYKSTEIGTYASNVTTTWTGKVTEKALYTAVGTAAYDNYTWTIYRNGDLVKSDYAPTYDANGDIDGYAYTHNARNAAIANGKTSTERVLMSGNGVLTQVFVDSDKSTVTLTMIDTGVAEVSKVSDNGDGTYEVTVIFKTKVADASGAVLSSIDTKYTTEDSFTKGDIVIYTASDDSKEIESLAVASTVSGKVTAQKNGDYTTLDGTAYSYNYAYTKGTSTTDKRPYIALYNLEDSEINNPAVDKDVTLYLDAYGYAVAYEGKAATAEDYLFITEISKSWTSSVTAKAVFYDGTKATIEVDKVGGQTATSSNVGENTIYKYSKGTSTYSLETVTEVKIGGMDTTDTSKVAGTNKDLSNKSPLISDSTQKVTTDNNTVFVNVVDEKAYTGYSNVTNMTKVAAKVVKNTKGVADIVFVYAYESVAAADDDFVILKGTGFEAVMVDGTKVYRATDAYDINGEQLTDLYFTSQPSNLTKGLYKITSRDGKDQVQGITALYYVVEGGTDSETNETVYVTGSDAYTYGSTQSTTLGGYYAVTAKNGVLTMNKDIQLDKTNKASTFAVNTSTSYVVIELNKKGDVDSIRTGDIGDIVAEKDANKDASYNNLTGVYVMTVDDASDAAPLAETVLVVIPKI